MTRLPAEVEALAAEHERHVAYLRSIGEHALAAAHERAARAIREPAGLPVITTCGACSACVHNSDNDHYECERDDWRDIGPSAREAPPSWCPLRGGK